MNSAWGCSIRRPALAVALVLALGFLVTGCTSFPRTNPNIAFMGDSITAMWWLPTSNLGVSGNTTTQMLARFSGEVSGHGFRALVILGGTNDIRDRAIPEQEEVDTAVANIAQMATLAEKDNLRVVLCKIPPISNLNGKVALLNAAIESYATVHQYQLVDYYTPMVGHPEYFLDGIHPNQEGYFVMQTALTKVISLDY